MGLKMEPPHRFICSITLEPMQQPMLCHICGNNFEEAAILAVLDDGRPCPMCRNFLTRENLVPNRALREEIQEWLQQARCPRPAETSEGEVFVPVAEPQTALFVGKTGSGKSKTINTIAGRAVARSIASGQGVTQGPKVAFCGTLREGDMESAVKMVDSKGLFDPSARNEETLTHLTQFLLEGVAGVDMIVHVVKLERLLADEIETPLCILHGLASDERERARLARRYRIIVTHCDTHDDDDEVDDDEAGEEQAGHPEARSIEQVHAEFRGSLKQAFPLELEPAVDNCIFVENNRKFVSDFNDPSRLRRWFLNELGRCRENRAICYRPKLLMNVLEGSRTLLLGLCQQHLSPEALRGASESHIHAIIHFFRYIQSDRKWNSPRPTDHLPEIFVKHWNDLNRIGRDSVALEIAEQALELVQQAAREAVERAAQERATAAEQLERAQEQLRVAEADRARLRELVPVTSLASTSTVQAVAQLQQQGCNVL